MGYQEWRPLTYEERIHSFVSCLNTILESVSAFGHCLSTDDFDKRLTLQRFWRDYQGDFRDQPGFTPLDFFDSARIVILPSHSAAVSLFCPEKREQNMPNYPRLVPPLLDFAFLHSGLLYQLIHFDFYDFHSYLPVVLLPIEDTANKWRQFQGEACQHRPWFPDV